MPERTLPVVPAHLEAVADLILWVIDPGEDEGGDDA